MRTKKTNTAQVTLGEGWRQFAFAQSDVELLGVIRRGIEIGALAKDADGNYMQLNGDMRQTLNKSRIDALLRSARTDARPAPIVRQPSAQDRAAVVVTIKPKRRMLVRD